MADLVTDSIFAPPQQRHQQQVQAQEFSVDLTNLLTAYVNFARMTGTPEELVLDFGLNTQMTPSLPEPIKLTQRLVLNYYTAKRLLGALYWADDWCRERCAARPAGPGRRTRPRARLGWACLP